MKKENKVGEIISPTFWTYYKVEVYSGHTNKGMNTRLNGTEPSPEIEPPTYDQWICDKVAKAGQ